MCLLGGLGLLIPSLLRPSCRRLAVRVQSRPEATLLPVLLRVFNVAFQAPLTVPRRGVMCSIKKSDVPAEELTSYRPITLLSCDAKLIMLVVSNR